MQKLVTLGKIVSDINRVKILALLKREKSLCVCEICDTLELSQPLVSRHLKQMREANLLHAEKSGKWMSYSLEKNTLLDFLLEHSKDEAEKLPPLIKCFKQKST